MEGNHKTWEQGTQGVNTKGRQGTEEEKAKNMKANPITFYVLPITHYASRSYTKCRLK